MFDYKKFKNPGKEYRSIPFWSLNGKLTKEELKKQLDYMKEMGFGGAFLHSRTGLETEYMSDEWLDYMEYCTQVLKENGMYTYLYDEDRYPSGTCGGMVTMNKEFREKSMLYYVIDDSKTFVKPETFLGYYALVLGEHKKCISYRKIDNFDDVKSNETIICVYIKYMEDDTFYNGFSMVDEMNRDATDKFIELTHEKYKQRLGHLFGSDIKGIFTDEPSRGPLFTGFSREREADNDNLVPYTQKLFEEFYKRNGYHLEDHLPVIWFGLESDMFSKVTYDYVETLEELFIENFAIPYHEWCKKNNLIFTGHILHEDNLAAQVIMSGSMMRFYEHFDYPGIDNLGSANYTYSVPSLVNSIAKQMGKEYVLDELYGVSGWPMKLEDYKRIGDWQSAGGVTLRCPHLAWYTMKGEAKRDCPATILHQSAWFRDYRMVEDYFARLTYLLKSGSDMVDIAIINPIESLWGLANQYLLMKFLCTKDPLARRIDDEYYILYKDLLLNGITCDYIDEGVYLDHGSVSGNTFRCGKKSYHTILLNGNYTLRSNTLKALQEFISNGGKVILIGDEPKYLDGNRHNFSNELNGVIKIPFDTSLLLPLLNKDIVETSSKNVIVEKRTYGEDLFLFLLNRQDNPESVSIKIKTNKYPHLLNLRDGSISNISYSRENDEVIINKDFACNEELAIFCSDDLPTLNMRKPLTFSPIEFNNEFSYELKEDNMLVLDKECELSIDDKVVACDYSVHADLALRRYLGLPIRDNQMLQPWFLEKYHKEAAHKVYGRCKQTYRFDVKNIPNYLKVMFELQDNEVITLNGHKIDLSKLEESIIDCCFSLANIPTEYLLEGENIIIAEFDYTLTSNVEALYLCGDFGVKLGENKDTIIELAKVIVPGDINEQGFPYFGGKIILHSKLDNGTYKASVEKMGPTCISINGKSIAFPPYETIFDVNDNSLDIEITYTRMNTFGQIGVGNSKDGVKPQELSSFVIYR